MQLNAELFRELNIIVTDEGMMEKDIKALRRITSPRKRVAKTESPWFLIWEAMSIEKVVGKKKDRH